MNSNEMRRAEQLDLVLSDRLLITSCIFLIGFVVVAMIVVF